ncbi:MAG: hypothetical protein U0838_02585 [Chloroflexota bacterium]
MTFPAWHIALCGLVASVCSLGLIRWRYRAVPLTEAVALASIVFVAVTGWRLAANVGVFNDDPIPPVSPNDILAPLAAYVLLGLYRDARPPAPAVPASVRPWLVAIALVVNVVVI